jgi:hypothetical protein
VIGVGREFDLTAVIELAVAVREPLVALDEGAASVGTLAGSIPERADIAASAAVLHIDEQVNFTAIVEVTVAVSETVATRIERAPAFGANGDSVVELTDVAAGPTVRQ